MTERPKTKSSCESEASGAETAQKTGMQRIKVNRIKTRQSWSEKTKIELAAMFVALMLMILTTMSISLGVYKLSSVIAKAIPSPMTYDTFVCLLLAIGFAVVAVVLFLASRYHFDVLMSEFFQGPQKTIFIPEHSLDQRIPSFGCIVATRPRSQLAKQK